MRCRFNKVFAEVVIATYAYQNHPHLCPNAPLIAPCDICGAESTTADGMVGMYLCNDANCLEVAWNQTYGRPGGDA